MADQKYISFMIPCLFSLGTLVSLYDGYQVASTGKIQRCINLRSHGRSDALCTQGPKLGNWLFSEVHAHLGYVLLCFLLAIALLGAAYISYRVLQYQSKLEI